MTALTLRTIRRRLQLERRQRNTSMIRVRDLPELIGSVSPRPFMYCEECQGRYSAHRGDYFMRAPDDVMQCCNRPCRLVVRQTTLVDVQPKGTK